MEIKLPSGMVVKARPWSLDDMGEMAIRASQPNAGDELIVDAITRQHVETVDPGPYPFVQAGDARFDWARVLKVDVMWTLYRLRAGSFPSYPDLGLDGEDYTYPYRCPDTACEGHKTESIQKLRLSDLPVRPLPRSSFDVMRSGKSFETKVAGRTVKFVLSTMALDAPLRAYIKRERKRTNNPHRPITPAENIAAQITHIEGVKGSEADIAARAKWLGALGAPDWVPLRDAIIKAAPIVGTKTDAICDVCGRVTTIPFPLGASFFAPTDPSDSLLDEETTGAGKETSEAEESPALST